MKNQFVTINNLIINKSKLTHDQKIFVNAVAKIGEDEGVRIYPNYSGRGMFGESCVGIDCCTRFKFRFRPETQSKDSLGLGKIIYFRGIPALPKDSYCDWVHLTDELADAWDELTEEREKEVLAELERFGYAT